MALLVKNLLANAGNGRDAGSISGLGRSPGGGHGNPLQYSCMENSMDRGAWWATVHGIAKPLADLPDPGIKPGSPGLQADSLPSEPPRKTSGETQAN